MMSKRLFGTDGIRGKANVWPITPEVAMRMGRAVARVLGADAEGKLKVVIGKDTRLSGYMLETALTAGLVSEGAKVLLTGPVPTPAIAHLTQSMGCNAGIMLTASHNPFEDNGIKVFGGDGYKLSDELESKLEEIILSEKVAEPERPGNLGKAFVIEDAVGRYIEFAKNAAGTHSLKGLKVVLDCAHGAAYFVGPVIFDELGVELIKLGVSPDGRNINEGYGALHPEKAAAEVVEHGADIGICFDGDADRVIFVDERGEVISGDRVLCLCAKALKADGLLKDDTLVATVMSNLGLRDALEADGIKLETTGVGDRLVIDAMRKGGYSLGGENSGHIIFSDNATTGDGIMSALKLLSMLKRSGKKLSELAACMDEYPQELHSLLVNEKPPIDEVTELRDAISGAEAAMGVEGRVLVRYSGTENKIRVLVEAKSGADAKRHAYAICKVVANTIGK